MSQSVFHMSKPPFDNNTFFVDQSQVSVKAASSDSLASVNLIQTLFSTMDEFNRMTGRWKTYDRESSFIVSNATFTH